MKRILVFALFAVMAMSALALADDMKKDDAAKPVTMTGEVIDLYCYMDHSATGMDHAKCAVSCIKKGLPVGFLSADGTMYVIIGKDHEPINGMVADYAGKKSTVTGTVKENGGVKALELATIAEAK
ncbi:MAG TPA: hypothetical protein VFH88_03650 [Candidatus Krumholzibacteria bacterium]|nr:hypothetical protein [Candidatus Krumholzibacteria bacterium]